MTIDLGAGVCRDEEPRNTQYHKRIIGAEPFAVAAQIYFIALACGHRATHFGDPAHLNGVAFCPVCRDADLRERRRKP